MKYTLFVGFALLALTSFGQSKKTEPQVTDQKISCLFPVGGGKVSDELLQAFLKTSPKQNPTVLLIPYAAKDDKIQQQIEFYTNRFKEVGVQNIEVLDIASPQDALKKINNADVIWMNGGSQIKLRRILESAKAGLPEAILTRYNDGETIIGGTSAGAGIMSSVMIYNSERIDGVLHPKISYGLKLWPEVIVDQHFTERKRLKRLEIAVSKHPGLIGIGIDEHTGILYTNKQEFKVVGPGTVTVLVPQDGGGHKKIILKNGDVYKM